MMHQTPEPPVARPRRRAEVSEPPAKANGAQPVEPPAGDPPAWRRYLAAIEEVRGARAELQRTAAWDPSLATRLRRADNAVVVVEQGLGYRATAPEGIVIDLTRMRDVRGDLTAEMMVSHWGVHLFGQRFNLSSGTQRSAVARELANRMPEGRADSPQSATSAVDWREVLEQLCIGTLGLARASAPLERVGALPTLPTPPRVIDPFLPVGATLMWGPQGTGKSTIAAALAVTMEEVVEVIPGWAPVAGGHVLVLDWEASAREWNDRVARIAAGVAIAPPEILYRRCRQPLAEMVEELAVEIERHEVRLLIVDSVEKAAGTSSEGTAYEDKANRLFLALDRLAVPSFLVDHVAGEDFRRGHSGPASVTPKSIGSVLKGAWARATYDLKREPASTDERSELLMVNVKINDARRLPPYEFSIRTDGDAGPITFHRGRLSSPELLAALPLPDRLWRLLAGAGRALPVKEIASELATSDGSIRALLSRDADRDDRRFIRLPDNSVALMQTGVDDA